MNFGRTELIISVSKAKFDEEADFEVRLAVAPRKRHEKLLFRSKIFEKQIFDVNFFFRFQTLAKILRISRASSTKQH